MARQADCPVKNLISFDALENPKWRLREAHSKDDEGLTVEEMISDVMKYHKRWREEEETYDKQVIEEVKDEFLLEFITHVNREEEHGFSTLEETTSVLRPRNSHNGGFKRSQSIKEIETKNLEEAYLDLLGKVKAEEKASDYGLLEAGLLKQTHKIILQDIPPPANDYTKPGEMSNKRRITEFNGEVYEYQNPGNMTHAVTNLLDKYNLLFDSCTKQGLISYDDYYNLFKICAWLLFELLDLHPFSDGNGRLCRILCSYSLSFFTPFPTPVYNVWTNSSKDEYKQALVDARKSDNRQPCALATMIIECSWSGWKKFFKELDQKIKAKNIALEDSSKIGSNEE